MCIERDARERIYERALALFRQEFIVQVLMPLRLAGAPAFTMLFALGPHLSEVCSTIERPQSTGGASRVAHMLLLCYSSRNLEPLGQPSLMALGDATADRID